MKKILSILFICLLQSVSLLSYQPGAETRFSIFPLNILTYEKRVDGALSNVFKVDGLNQFVRLVVNSPRPVALRMFDGGVKDSVKDVFHIVAEKHRKDVLFAALDIDKNRELIGFFYKTFKFNKDQLPLVLFFLKRQIILPVLSGTTTVGHLSREVVARFGILEK